MRRKNNKGFTFIELILYMAILGIFMVAVMSIVGTTVASNKKHRARQKLQTQATESYDTISNMVMGANMIMINGKGYVGTGSGTSISYSEVTGSFITPNQLYRKASDGSLILSNSNANVVKSTTSGASSVCYDIADLKSFAGTAASSDTQTFIDVDYLWISYDSAIGTASFCTIKYDKTAKKLYISRAADLTGVDYNDYQNALSTLKTINLDKYKGGAGAPSIEEASAKLKLQTAQATIDTYTKYSDSTADGTLLAKDVTSFQMQVNPGDNSVALIIGFQDKNTKEKYSVTSVVGLRNSFVLKPHEWN